MSLRKTILKVSLLGSMTMGLSACEPGNQEGFATLLGAGLGAWMGAELGSGAGESMALATMGAAIGSAIGNDIGRALDERDRMLMQRARQRSLENQPSGTTTTWRNPDTGHRGTITPKPATKNKSGEYCREYTQTVTIAGKTEEAYGTACRMPDGSWKITS